MSRQEHSVPRKQALVVDFYGVLTSGLDDAMVAWCAADGFDYLRFREVMGEWLGPEGQANAALNPVFALERGELAVPDFERQLANRLQSASDHPLDPAGLVGRMFDRFQHAPDMVGLVRRARTQGIRTALLSNSWGDQYLRAGWAEMFDVVVISGEVGMRKPEREIFALTTDRLNLDASQIAFVDDHVGNIHAAATFGWTAVHHVDYRTTLMELEAIFGTELA